MEAFSTIEEYIDSFHPELNEIISESNGKVIVSGSSAMYFYMKEKGLEPEFIPNDLDVFVYGTRSLDKFLSIKRKCGYYISDHHDNKHYCRVVKYEINNKKIDFIFLIGILGATLSEYICSVFDLDICKCWFDGKELHGPYDILKSKTCKLNIIWHRAQRIGLEKLVEYLAKVSIFDPTSEPEENEFDPYNYLKRIRKYTKRGFTIITKDCQIDPTQLSQMICTRIMDNASNLLDEFDNLGIKVKLWTLFSIVNDNDGDAERLAVEAKDFIKSIRTVRDP